MISVGDLVYVPSEVMLQTESSVMKLVSPQNLLITGKKQGKYEVYYEGRAWMASEADIYKLGENNG